MLPPHCVHRAATDPALSSFQEAPGAKAVAHLKFTELPETNEKGDALPYAPALYETHQYPYFGGIEALKKMCVRPPPHCCRDTTWRYPLTTVDSSPLGCPSHAATPLPTHSLVTLPCPT